LAERVAGQEKPEGLEEQRRTKYLEIPEEEEKILEE